MFKKIIASIAAIATLATPVAMAQSVSTDAAYISADGLYSKCANFQTLFGADEKAGTLDDLKVLVIVYQGWLY